MYAKLRAIEIYQSYAVDHLVLPHKKRFFEKKKSSATSPCLICFMIFEEKYFSCYILLTDPVSLSGYFYFVK